MTDAPAPRRRIAFSRLRAKGAIGIPLLILLAGAPAHAHSALKRSTPAAGAVARAVSEIRLVFSQGVEAALSAVTLTRAGVAVIDQRKPEAADATTLILRLDAPLPPGHYTLDWRAMSVDTHIVRGTFSFEAR